MPHVLLPHAPKTREELWWTVRVLFGVTIPRTKVCPDHCAPFDAFADAYFRECTIGDGEPYTIRRAIWHASRGLAGKSKTLSTLGLTFAYAHGADITILGGSMAQSANVYEYMVAGQGGKNLPPGMILDQTATKILLANRGRVRPLPASQRNVRGPHPSILLMDEVDEMDLDIYDAALGQPMPQPNYLDELVQTMTVMSSTWQYGDGTLTEIFRRADEEDPANERGDRKTPVYRWCYKENDVRNNPVSDGIPEGWLLPETTQEKRDSISAEMFRVEYDLGEPSIGNRAIDTEKLDLVFSSNAKPIWEKHDKDWDEWRFAKRIRGATYSSGTDWAKEQDKTVISIARVDGAKRELVYTARINRTNYPRMVGLLNRELQYYRTGHNGSWHDSTGLGNVVDDYVDKACRAFSMTGEKRTKLLSDYVNAVEKVTWVLPKFLTKYYTEHKYCQVGDLYSTAQAFHLPDTVCSLALAELGAKRVARTAAPVAVGRSGTPSRTERSFSHPSDEARTLVTPGSSTRRIVLTV